jgi:hypothetical protein
VTFEVIAENGNSRTVDTRSEAEDVKHDMETLGMDVEITSKATDGGFEVIETPDEESREVTETLPDEGPSVDEDPLTWMPDEFTDVIDGTVSINRKGYEVMAHHYDISTECTCIVGPEQSDFEFCRMQATATDPDGNTYTAHGSAHIDRGDDKVLLLEMADTRARKRAIAQATGVGMVAVEELQNSP